MTVDRLPGRVREFANYLDGLLARLDQSGGWCGVFWQRDPDGMRACLDGREVPPWDVVESLLHDLAAEHGPAVAGPERDRARALHAAALAAYDTGPGARDALNDRLDVMLREQRYAARRQAELTGLLSTATTREEADAIRLDVAWARDDHERATARCAELRARITRLNEPGAPPGPRVPADLGAARGAHPAAEPQPPTARKAATAPRTPAQSPAPVPAPGEPPAVPKQRRKRRGSARFAGMLEEDAVPVVTPPAAEAPAPVPADGGRTPRGARFAGADDAAPEATEPAFEQVDADGLREVDRVVGALARLRAEGRSGEAHALLVEAAHWPAVRYPPLAAGLRRAGLDADWATLLWEAASLPADRLVAAADALVAAGHAADGQQILRQGVVRPPAEVGTAVLALAGEGRRREVRALLDAYVRMRTPEESVRGVDPDPVTLVPLLLEAARGVSDERYWDLVHALRVAGHAT